MAKAGETIYDAIGGTPTVRLSRVVPKGAGAVHLKLEHFSPNGAMHDRVARALFRRHQAALVEAKAAVVPGTGNVAIGLAMFCAEFGVSLTAVMPDHMTLERRQALKSYRARVELTPAEQGVDGARARARALAAGKAVLLDPYDDPASLQAQAESAAELLEAIDVDGGRVDAFACGVGTGAALTAFGRALKPSHGAKIVAVEPESSVLAGESPQLHRLLGIGTDFVPPLLDRKVVDRIVKVDARSAWEMKARLGREEGLLVGIATGAHVVAAIQLARELGPDGRVYTLATDTGERYFSFAEQFA